MVYSFQRASGPRRHFASVTINQKPESGAKKKLKSMDDSRDAVKRGGKEDARPEGG